MDRLRKNSLGNRFTPSLEALSDRVVPSCTWSTEGGVLTIEGDQKANEIVITDDGTDLIITCDGDNVDVAEDVTSIVIKTGSGNDTVTYDVTSDGTAVVDYSLEVKLGNGWDTFDGSVTGDLATGSALDLDVKGCNGKDSLNFDVDGGVAADSTLTVFLGGGNGKDVVTGDYTGLLIGDLTWDVNGGNGKDEVGGEFTFDAGSTGTADVEVLGQRAPDALTLLVFDNSGDDGDPATDDTSTLGADSSFTADGGLHKDTADVSDVVELVSAKEVNN